MGCCLWGCTESDTTEATQQQQQQQEQQQQQQHGHKQGFPGGSNSKKPTRNAGDQGSVPESGRLPSRREWLSTPVFLPGESQGQRSVVGYSPWDRKESDMND